MYPLAGVLLAHRPTKKVFPLWDYEPFTVHQKSDAENRGAGSPREGCPARVVDEALEVTSAVVATVGFEELWRI